MEPEDAHMASPSSDEELEDWPPTATSSAPTTPSRRGGLSAASSDYDPDPDFDDHHGSTNDHPDFGAPSQGIATYTAFDAYFLHASKPARTSANIFSQLVPPLTPEEHAAALSRVQQEPRERERVLWRDARARRAWFRRIRTELAEGFNVLLYGYGSKREFLNAFAADVAARGHHVVVANAFNPAFAFKDLLAAIERVPGVLDPSPAPGASATTTTTATTGGGADAQVQRIHAFFSREQAPELYVVAHNVEGGAFRAPKHRAALALLALAPHIHLAASVDHIAAPARWSLSEILARKPDPPASFGRPVSPTRSRRAPQEPSRGLGPRRGFAWLWHDLTTLAPYDFELAYADPGALAGAAALRGTRAPAASAAALAAAAAGVGGAGGAAAAVTETAARHVLASVTQKAKKLFVLLGTRQLEKADGGGEDEEERERERGNEAAYDYDRLFAAARDNFVATNDTALRALLAEFRDHGLVVATTSAAGAETLWIPMRREGLLRIVGELQAEGH
ncbi:origin recognition complex subunit 2-domain-containing protein [Dichomitus squalens]|uniref:Origin recognition complex subunit 2 n=1 Tax=Dichomitus squalens TaxID=114155 RepID=A0A4Q9M943_9APHY|nr:origin recognition complex subunit 2-domain-containing protein [Dichomitus squalens]